ncbi:hypothetical protein SAMN02745857_03129 [Andreprevotia lacus DSM 23236]|jgi:ABC-type uncharacterized transport system permease subunit|uniref:Uncharacterized protein n=1 Tax=Andreprevotia lacus DSM 23236 TaxID=1121001 RepID=A0A1W1XWA1_9NEIS|nr:hypothetical protein [Andreprevotia lacus]SMC28114.1 hypothetical protein SAMN02745857_03129 [Andreprevotia lacus DSM 23236]
MKKQFALLVLLLCGVVTNAFALEARYYELSNYTQVDGPSYCEAVWPGSHYFGVRMGFNGNYFLACQK